MVKGDLNIGFQGLASIQSQIYNPETYNDFAQVHPTSIMWCSMKVVYNTSSMTIILQGTKDFDFEAVQDVPGRLFIEIEWLHANKWPCF